VCTQDICCCLAACNHLLSIGAVWPAIDHKLPCPLIIRNPLGSSLRAHIGAWVSIAGVRPIRVRPRPMSHVLLLLLLLVRHSPWWYICSICGLHQTHHCIIARAHSGKGRSPTRYPSKLLSEAASPLGLPLVLCAAL